MCYTVPGQNGIFQREGYNGIISYHIRMKPSKQTLKRWVTQMMPGEPGWGELTHGIFSEWYGVDEKGRNPLLWNLFVGLISAASPTMYPQSTYFIASTDENTNLW